MEERKNKSGETVKEYFFEDWKKGDFPLTASSWPGTTEVEEVNDKGKKTGKKWIEYVSAKEYKKIEPEQEKLYQDEVNRLFESMKKGFNKRLKKSIDKKTTLKEEIGKSKLKCDFSVI